MEVLLIMDRLDETDERILAELAEHARATFAEIGQRVNLSAPAVKRRVDRMLDNGVIRGFTTVVDRNALGWNTEAYVQVFCHGTIAPDELRAAWVDIPEVISAANIACAAAIPVNRSATATPTFIGGPSVGPVTAISPPSPWTT